MAIIKLDDDKKAIKKDFGVVLKKATTKGNINIRLTHSEVEKIFEFTNRK